MQIYKTAQVITNPTQVRKWATRAIDQVCQMCVDGDLTAAYVSVEVQVASDVLGMLNNQTESFKINVDGGDALWYAIVRDADCRLDDCAEIKLEINY